MSQRKQLQTKEKQPKARQLLHSFMLIYLKLWSLGGAWLFAIFGEFHEEKVVVQFFAFVVQVLFG